MRRMEAQAVLGELAAGQFGLVTHAQAAARDIDGVTLHRLRAAKLLAFVGRGVYQVVGAVTPTHLDTRVAWLRLDPSRPAWERNGRGEHDGVVSHRSACLLHQLGDIPAPKVELSVPRRVTTRDPSVVLHNRHGVLPAGDVTIVDGLPTTTVERTVVDLLSQGTDGGHVGRVIAEAVRRDLVSIDALARRAEPFAKLYPMKGATGAELLAFLVAQAGTRLRQDKAVDAVARAAAAGFADALRCFSATGVRPVFPALVSSASRGGGGQLGESHLSNALAALHATAPGVGSEAVAWASEAVLSDLEGYFVNLLLGGAAGSGDRSPLKDRLSASLATLASHEAPGSGLGHERISLVPRVQVLDTIDRTETDAAHAAV